MAQRKATVDSQDNSLESALGCDPDSNCPDRPAVLEMWFECCASSGHRRAIRSALDSALPLLWWTEECPKSRSNRARSNNAIAVRTCSKGAVEPVWSSAATRSNAADRSTALSRASILKDRWSIWPDLSWTTLATNGARCRSNWSADANQSRTPDPTIDTERVAQSERYCRNMITTSRLGPCDCPLAKSARFPVCPAVLYEKKSVCKLKSNQNHKKKVKEKRKKRNIVNQKPQKFVIKRFIWLVKRANGIVKSVFYRKNHFDRARVIKFRVILFAIDSFFDSMRLWRADESRVVCLFSFERRKKRIMLLIKMKFVLMKCLETKRTKKKMKKSNARNKKWWTVLKEWQF